MPGSCFVTHMVYNSACAFSARGAVVGILRMGTRKLFVYDHMNHQHEMEPLCVLDFYVHESRQRMGCGKKLYDYMLQVKTETLTIKYVTVYY